MTVAMSGAKADSAIVFAGQAQGGLLRSETGGQTWYPSNDGLAGRLVVGLWPSPGFATDRTMFTASLDNGIERSRDGGASWEPVNFGLPTLQIPTLVVSPAFVEDQTLLAGCAEGLFRSANAGKSWEPVGEEFAGVDVRLLAVSPGFPIDNVVFAATGDNRILRSEDGGLHWQPIRQQISEEMVALTCSPGFEKDRVIFVGTYNVDPKQGTGVAAIWRGDESGDKLSCQTTYRSNNRWVAFGIPASFAGTGMFFVGVHNTVLRPMLPSTSAEGFSRRRVWKAEPVAPINGSVVALAVSPGYSEDRILFAATSDGVYKSATGGLSWKSIGDGLIQKSIVAVTLSPDFVNDREVFAVSLGGDLWRFIDR